MALILLLNCGSSSIKYQLLDPEVGVPEAVGLIQRIGQTISTIDHEVGDKAFHDERRFANHEEAVAAIVETFEAHGPSLDGVVAVGHRTVHGGQEFIDSVEITDAVVDKLRELIPLAPLHNPPAIAGIEGAKHVLPEVPHVAIFDTAFFSSLPEEAYTYAIDRRVAKKYGIRRYGFHGTSHNYVSQRAAEFLGRPLEEMKMIVAHIGNGASMSAIDGGVAVDTSMGLTPLEGLMMGTRSGDLDPGIINYLYTEGAPMEDIDNMLNKRSGLLGISDRTDMRDIVAAVESGDPDAELALKLYVRRLVKYIGAYAAILGGVDVLVFTAGVGENAAEVRKRVVNALGGLGFELDEKANQVRSKEPRQISTAGSGVTVLVVPTNEELAMAKETVRVIGQ